MRNKFNVLQTWLDNVAYSHSGSLGTEAKYRHNLTFFFEFTGKTADQILQEYEGMSDREFKRKYAQYVRGLIGYLAARGYSTNTVTSVVSTIKSFFKYNDLPLGYVPLSRNKVVFHNRDIEKREIEELLRTSKPRERAFFSVMAQSGLRPLTICELKLKHVQPDFDNNVVPCKIDVPEEIAKGKYRSYFTFIGPEAVKHLKDYLKGRPRLTPESYLFTLHGTEEKADSKSISHRFRDAVLKLKRAGFIDYEQKQKGKPGSIRLYSLRKWFRKQSHQAGFEIVQFWMGHLVKEGQEEHYRPKDVEFHRKLYTEKAMPFLRIEKATPTDTEKIIETQNREIDVLKREVATLRRGIQAIMKMEKMTEFARFEDGKLRTHETEEGKHVLKEELEKQMRKRKAQRHKER